MHKGILTVLLNNYMVRQHASGIQLMVFLSFHKLADVNLQSAAYGAKSQAKRCRSFTFTIACVYVGIPFTCTFYL